MTSISLDRFATWFPQENRSDLSRSVHVLDIPSKLQIFLFQFWFCFLFSKFFIVFKNSNFTPQISSTYGPFLWRAQDRADYEAWKAAARLAIGGRNGEYIMQPGVYLGIFSIYWRYNGDYFFYFFWELYKYGVYSGNIEDFILSPPPPPGSNIGTTPAVPSETPPSLSSLKQSHQCGYRFLFVIIVQLVTYMILFLVSSPLSSSPSSPPPIFTRAAERLSKEAWALIVLLFNRMCCQLQQSWLGFFFWFRKSPPPSLSYTLFLFIQPSHERDGSLRAEFQAFQGGDEAIYWLCISGHFVYNINI